MRKSIDLKGWLKESNNGQVEWAVNYLIKLRKLDGNATYTYKGLLANLNNVPESPEKRELLRNMKAAWQRKKGRDKPDGNKAYNFIMPTSLQTELNNLSKKLGKPKNKVIAQLIEDAAENTKYYLESLSHPLSKKIELLEKKIERLERQARKFPSSGRESTIQEEEKNLTNVQVNADSTEEEPSPNLTVSNRVTNEDSVDSTQKSTVITQERITTAKTGSGSKTIVVGKNVGI